MVDTIIVQIGNSDDKLDQKGWSDFVRFADHLIQNNGRVHFAGGSPASAPWQNYCWVFEPVDSDRMGFVRASLRTLCKKFDQDSIALTVGSTEFIRSAGNG